MAGKKWKKILAAGLCGLMAAGLIAGCGGSDGGKSYAKMKVGVVQIVQHPALDESNKGFVDALNEQGLKDKVDIDQQNAQGDQSNLRSIANRFVSGNYNLICAISTPAAQTSGLVPRQDRSESDGDAYAGNPSDGGRHSASQSGVPSGHANPTQVPVQQPSHAVIAMRGGSGDGEHLMRAAVVALDSVPGNQVTGISPLYHVSAIDGPDSMSAVVLVDTRLDLAALSHLLASINDKHRDTLALHAVTMRSDAEGGRHEQVGWQEAKTKASILAPWMDIEPDASFDGDPLSYLLALAPDATQVGLLSDSWILGGMQ